MNLKDYFDQKKQISVSNADKLEIYQKFITKRNQKTFYSKREFFSVKTFSYWLIFIVLLIWLYWTYFFNWSIIINSDWFFVQKPNWIQSVQADYIAKVIDFNWNFYIYNNWQYYQSSFIQDWDTVTLKKDSELIIHINNSTESKILWPAKFIINKNNDKYRLNLIYWDFIKVKSLDQNTDQNIELSTKNFTIKQANNQALNFEISKEWEQTLLKNNWSQLILTQTQDNWEKSIEINQDKILTIQDNDISILDDQKLWQAINEKNISQTLSFDYSSNDLDTQEDIENLIENFWKNTEEIDSENIVNKVWLDINQKIIPTENQISKLDSTLSKSNLIKDLENISKTYLLWDTSINSKLSILNNKLSQVANNLDVNYVWMSWEDPYQKINLISTNINTLISNIEQKYHIPTRYTNNLNNTSNRLNQLKKYNYWQLTENTEEIVNIISNIKNYITFQ